MDAILDATHGRGADLVLDCSGVPSTFTEALKVVRTGGVVVEAGAFVDMGPVQMNPNSDICTRNVAVLGIGGELATEYEPSMRLMAANLNRYPLTQDHHTHSPDGPRSRGGHACPVGRSDAGRCRSASATDARAAVTQRLKVGVVGAGIIAQVMHLHYLRELADHFEVVALCDIAPRKR